MISINGLKHNYSNYNLNQNGLKILYENVYYQNLYARSKQK